MVKRAPLRSEGRDIVPDYEKPLQNRGKRRLWRNLKSGERVTVIQDGNTHLTGTVDVRTQDGSTVWVWLDQGLGRVAVSEGDHTELAPLKERTAPENSLGTRRSTEATWTYS